MRLGRGSTKYVPKLASDSSSAAAVPTGYVRCIARVTCATTNAYSVYWFVDWLLVGCTGCRWVFIQGGGVLGDGEAAAAQGADIEMGAPRAAPRAVVAAPQPRRDSSVPPVHASKMQLQQQQASLDQMAGTATDHEPTDAELYDFDDDGGAADARLHGSATDDSESDGGDDATVERRPLLGAGSGR